MGMKPETPGLLGGAVVVLVGLYASWFGRGLAALLVPPATIEPPHFAADSRVSGSAAAR